MSKSKKGHKAWKRLLKLHSQGILSVKALEQSTAVQTAEGLKPVNLK